MNSEIQTPGDSVPTISQWKFAEKLSGKPITAPSDGQSLNPAPLNPAQVQSIQQSQNKNESKMEESPEADFENSEVLKDFRKSKILGIGAFAEVFFCFPETNAHNTTQHN